MKEIKIFNDYVKQFDLKVKAIMYKYHHTFRVMNYCNEIAVSQNLSKQDIYIANVCGLLHDIARFKQYTEYNTFNDYDSFDHGDMGYEISKTLIDKFKLKKEEQNYVLNAVKYHNKKDIPFIDNKTNLFMNIVRDADKLDIMVEQNNNILEDEIIIKYDIYNEILNNKVCGFKNIITSYDKVLRQISWVNDLNFKYTKDLVYKILDKKFKLLEIYGTNIKIDKLKEYAFNKLKES